VCTSGLKPDGFRGIAISRVVPRSEARDLAEPKLMKERWLKDYVEVKSDVVALGGWWCSSARSGGGLAAFSLRES
jgi:hypothetical protein